MTEYLIQRKTGKAFVRTDALVARGDMVPARYDAEKKAFVPALDETDVIGPAPFPQKPAQAVPETEVKSQPKVDTPVEATVVKTPENVPDNHPLMALTKEELDNLCAEKYGKALDRTKKKKEMIFDFLAIEAAAIVKE